MDYRDDDEPERKFRWVEREPDPPKKLRAPEIILEERKRACHHPSIVSHMAPNKEFIHMCPQCGKHWFGDHPYQTGEVIVEPLRNYSSSGFGPYSF